MEALSIVQSGEFPVTDVCIIVCPGTGSALLFPNVFHERSEEVLRILHEAAVLLVNTTKTNLENMKHILVDLDDF